MATDAVPVLPLADSELTDAEATDLPSRGSKRSGRVRRITRGLMRWLGINEGIAFGILIGATLAVIGLAVATEMAGLTRLTIWEHSFETRRLDRISSIMDHQLALADGALTDGAPLELSSFLADDYMGQLYHHHMSFAAHLLATGQIDRFNELRRSTGYLQFDLSNHDLSGLDLGGAALMGVDLTGADLSGCDLSGADLSRARLVKADLSGTMLDGTDLSQADLTDAILSRASGSAPIFREAILTNASLFSITAMMGARFDGATMAQANLCSSALTGAVLDHADLTMASAVGADLSQVASMADVDLSGANLGSARLSPLMMPRAWLVNARGLDEPTAEALRRAGAVLEREEVLDLVDGRIIAGFRTQIEQDGTIAESLQTATLLRMLKDYYQH